MLQTYMCTDTVCKPLGPGWGSSSQSFSSTSGSTIYTVTVQQSVENVIVSDIYIYFIAPVAYKNLSFLKYFLEPLAMYMC